MKGQRQKVKGKTQNTKFKTQNSLAPFVLLLVIAAAGCGYQFSGRGEEFPQDVRTVFVEPFLNKTHEVGLEREFTATLKSELHQRGQLQVVDSLDLADAVLSGVMRTFDSRVVGINRYDEALQYEMALVVDMGLRRRSPDQLLWRTQGARFSDLFFGERGAVVTTSSDFRSRTLNPGDLRQFTDIQLSETLKQDARGRLVQAAARDLHSRLLEMF